MNFNKCISKFLAKSLLVSTGISCFGCSVSYMGETSDKKPFIDAETRKKLEDKKSKEELIHEIFSGSSSDVEESLKKEHRPLKKEHKFLKKKRFEPKSDESKSDESESDEPESDEPKSDEPKYFDDKITRRLAYVLWVGEQNKYLMDLKELKSDKTNKTKNKEKYAETAYKLDMLEIARLIYALEKLDSERLLDKYPEVKKILDKINEIQSKALDNKKVSYDQLILFVENFKKITDKIKFKYKKSRITIREMMKVFKKNENGEFECNYLCGLLFEMFKTLDYCERKKCPNPGLLYNDASTKDVTTTEKVYSNLNKY